MLCGTDPKRLVLRDKHQCSRYDPSMVTSRAVTSIGQQSFADWLTTRMGELELSTRDVARAAGTTADGTPRISPSTVGRYASGAFDPRRMSEDALKALAKAVRTPERVVRDKASLPVLRGTYKPPPESVYLTDEDRLLVDTMIRRLVSVGTQTRITTRRPRT